MHRREPADWPLRGREPGHVGPASLQLDAQSVRHPIDVVEVGDDFVQVDDIAVCEPGGTQRSKGASTRTLEAGRIMERVRAAIDVVYAFETPDALTRQGVQVAFGAPRFVDEDTIAMADGHVTGRHFIVCTGAEPIVPSIPGLVQTPFLTYRDVFSLKAIPHRLLVLGSGPIGAELAQSFVRLGSEVVLVEAADRLLPSADPDASAALCDMFTRAGVEVYVRAPVEHVKVTGDGIALTAARRWPRLGGLNLERAGVAFTEVGISVDSKLRTSNPRIYAAGDAAGSMQFTHYAGWLGYVAARNALFPGAMRGKREGVPWVVFTDPEVGQVGRSSQRRPCVNSVRPSTSTRRTGSAFSNWPRMPPLPGSIADGRAACSVGSRGARHRR